VDAWVAAVATIAADPGAAERRAAALRAGAHERFAWAASARAAHNAYALAALRS
jgi:hypothetical protein